MQGFNKYYPPDFDPSKEGSLNKLNGKHALGDRAKKINEGILIVRFELPYNIWCGGCNKHLGMGVRYNAEKKKVGNYFSTPIFAFRCKCHLCSHWFVIQTDPKNTRYVVTEGAREKNEQWDPGENGGIPIIEEKSLIEPDAFASLEKDKTQKVKALSDSAALEALQDLSTARSLDPYTLNKNLRATFRTAKVIRKVSESKGIAILDKYALGESKITKEDLMTPRAEIKEEEDQEWELAKLERGRREGILIGKRKREDSPSSSSHSQRTSSTHTSKSKSPSKSDSSNRLKSLALKMFAGAASKNSVFDGSSSSKTSLELKGIKKMKR